MLPVTSTNPPAADALEQRDLWRNVWQAFTGDVLLAVLCAFVLLGLIAGYGLPQSPAGGTADPLAYSQWQSQARALTGRLYDTAAAVGLFSVAQSFWLRAALVILAAVVILRLADRLARLLAARHTTGALRDEQRLRVTDQAPALLKLISHLRAQRYRVVTSPSVAADQSADDVGWLVADRAPWAELTSILMHIGLLLAAAGMLMNGMLGWDVAHQQVDSESAIRLPSTSLNMQLLSADNDQQSAVLRLPGEQQDVLMALDRPAQLPWLTTLPLPCCLALRLVEITPGYRISAQDAAGQPLTITASSYAAPTNEVLLTFRRDEPQRLVGVEQARMAVLVSDADGGRVQVYSVPSGQILTSTQIQPSVIVSTTTLLMTPATSAVISAQYRPGNLLLLAGAVLALLGFIAVTLWPIQRLVVRHHGQWTEFYASGRGARDVVRDLLQTERGD